VSLYWEAQPIVSGREIPKAVEEAARRDACRYGEKTEHYNYSACPLCGVVQRHGANPGKTFSMYLWWGDVCETCADMRRRFPDVFDWVVKVLAFTSRLRETEPQKGQEP